MSIVVQEKAEKILDEIKRNEKLGRYVDQSLHIPKPYRGNGKIKLIVLGQDPTVKNASSRINIQTVLNLDKNRSVTAYLSGVCNTLGIKIRENVYATNLYKNFFIDPPTTIKEVNIFTEFLGYWLEFLKEELDQFGNLPVLTLGEPILAPILNPNVAIKVREYWGYDPEWKKGKSYPFQFIEAHENKLERMIFPFPHQPSIRKEFYRTNLDRYAAYMGAIVSFDA